MYCAHCGTKNDEGIESCDRCGELLTNVDSSYLTHLGVKACPDCKRVNVSGARFCTDCGRNLDDVIPTRVRTRLVGSPEDAIPVTTDSSPADTPVSVELDSQPNNPHGGQKQPGSSSPVLPTVSIPSEEVSASKLNDSGTPRANLPQELQGWNWGGLLLPFVWGPFNRVWVGLAVLLVFIPPMSVVLVLFLYGPAAIFLGMRGNELAWRARKWDSVEHFRVVQAQWAKWAAIIFALLAISMLMFLISNLG